MAFVYCIENLVDRKRYIGCTNRAKLSQRMAEHFYNANRRIGHPLYDALRELGRGSFKYYVVYEGDDAFEKEDFYIQLMGEYNQLIDGHYSEASKQRISESLEGKTRILTESHKLNISKGKTGLKRKPFTEEHKRNLSLALKGNRNAGRK